MQLAYEDLPITPFYTGVFSNWHPSEFSIAGIKFNCVEQYMMFAKAKFFKDEETALKIMKSSNPGEQKALGRTVKNFSAPRWNAIARHTVFVGCNNKFKNNPDLLKELEKTKGTLLVEASPIDCIWGVGLPIGPDVYDRSKWKGTNWLGEVLTDVRIGIFGE